jgi:ankyrin repeat protein
VAQDLATMRLLVEYGALVDLPNVMGVTPLMAAVGLGGGGRGAFGAAFGGEARAIEIADLLLAAGADVNARIVDRYDLTASVGRTPNAMTDREGHTALFAAVSRGWGQVVEHLIANGAEVDIVDARGTSAVDVALGRFEGRGAVVSEEIASYLQALVEIDN